jgi:hypothetical protein
MRERLWRALHAEILVEMDAGSYNLAKLKTIARANLLMERQHWGSFRWHVIAY